MISISAKLSDLLSRPISSTDRARAAVLVLDWSGCAVAGRAEPAGQKMAAAFGGESGSCSRIGAGQSSPLMAALHNGALGNVLEMDDVDRQAVLHAAPTVIPAALAMAEHTGASAKDFLNAVVIGYEATIRVGRAVGPNHYAFWHNTATCGPFGAAAAACHLLPGSDLVSALGLAGTQAAGLWQTRHEPGSMAKQLHAAHAAHAGVLSAMLSAQGFQGPRSILEGEQGFFAAMCKGANPEDILKDPDADWLLHGTSLKPYPACRHAHPAIDAALALKASGADISGPIEIASYKDALKFCDRPNPQSTIEAKFSLQHSVAVTLLRGAPNLKDFDADCIADPKLTAMRGRISVRDTEKFNAAYPQHYGAQITAGGKTAIAENAFGDPEVPMDEAALIAKAKMLMQHGGMNSDAAADLCKAALQLASGGTFTDFTKLLS